MPEHVKTLFKLVHSGLMANPSAGPHVKMVLREKKDFLMLSCRILCIVHCSMLQQAILTRLSPICHRASVDGLSMAQ